MKPAIYPPLLLAAYPVLALLASNLGEAFPEDAVRPLAISLALGLGLTLFLRLLVRDWIRAGLIASVVIGLFFAYGHIYQLLKPVHIGSFILGRHRYLLPLWAAILVAWTWFVVRGKANFRRVAQLFTIVGLASLVLPLAGLASYLVENSASANALPAEVPRQMAETTLDPASLPDIYYIILDGYGREDVLARVYGYDNSTFIHELEARGFYVAGKSTSNYNRTVLSFASSLNLQYLDQVVPASAQPTSIRNLLVERAVKSEVRSFLGDLGYRMVTFETSYRALSYGLQDAEVYYPAIGGAGLRSRTLPSFLRATAFEGLLLESSVVSALLDSYALRNNKVLEDVLCSEFQLHRERTLSAFARLPEIPGLEGPHFVLAHIIAPHPPFVFGRNGEALHCPGSFSLEDSGSQYSPEAYVQGYVDQMTYVNQLVLATVDEILARSDTTPIIILQGDHGPAAYQADGSLELSNLRERMSILNAYFLSGRGNDGLYPEITPVNSFRLIFDRFFGTQLGLLPDENYYAPSDQPYDFFRVTDDLD